jgi:predicted nucleotidyltransferase
MRTTAEVLPQAAACRLADYKRAVVDALPGEERVILFGSRARGQGGADSDYDVAVIVRDLSDRRGIRRVLSDLAYDQILDGFFVRPIPLPPDYLTSREHLPKELADDILRDGVERDGVEVT